MTKVEIIMDRMTPAEKRTLKQFEGEIASGILDANKAAALIGKALWDIRDEQLWRGEYASFADYALDRWGLSRSRAYRLVQIAKEASAHPERPVPAQWQLEPAKVARREQKALPSSSSPTGGTEVVESPPVIDAEGWEEPVIPVLPDGEDPSLLPVSDSAAQLPPNPPVVVDQQVVALAEVGPGVGTVDSPSDPGPAEAENPSGSAGTGSAGSLPQRTPVVDLMENLQASLSEDETNPDEIGHVVEQWSSLSGTPIPEPVVTLDTKCPYCPYDGEIVTAHLPTCEWVAGQVYRQTGIPSSPQTFTVALMNLLSDADLDALGSTMTTNEMDTLTKAYEQIRSAHVAAQPKKPVARTRKAAPKVPAKPAVTAKSNSGVGRREVTPIPKPTKAGK